MRRRRFSEKKRPPVMYREHPHVRCPGCWVWGVFCKWCKVCRQCGYCGWEKK